MLLAMSGHLREAEWTLAAHAQLWLPWLLTNQQRENHAWQLQQLPYHSSCKTLWLLLLLLLSWQQQHYTVAVSCSCNSYRKHICWKHIQTAVAAQFLQASTVQSKQQ